MVGLWRVANVLMILSVALPLLGLLAFYVDSPANFTDSDALLFTLSFCAGYSAPPMLGWFGLSWANPLKRSLPFMKGILWFGIVVGAISPAISSLLLVFIVWSSPGGSSHLQDYYSLWYGHAPPAIVMLVIQAIGIIILALAIGGAWIFERRGSRLGNTSV